jgi:ribosomal protein S6
MFLVDSSQAATDWDGIVSNIKNILTKAGAEIISLKKWADRKLAYEIKHKTRGTYILCYFSADSEKIRDIERDVQLTERILRLLILSVDKQRTGYSEKPDEIPVDSSGKAEKSDADMVQVIESKQEDAEDTIEKSPNETED